MAASMIGTLAGAAGLTGTAAALASEASGQRGHPIVRAPDTRPEPGSSARVPARANDSMKGLTTPIPPQAPMTEGTADIGNT